MYFQKPGRNFSKTSGHHVFIHVYRIEDILYLISFDKFKFPCIKDLFFKYNSLHNFIFVQSTLEVGNVSSQLAKFTRNYFCRLDLFEKLFADRVILKNYSLKTENIFYTVYFICLINTITSKLKFKKIENVKIVELI